MIKSQKDQKVETPKHSLKFFPTWKKVMFHPNAFFEELPKEISYKELIFFVLKITAITYLIESIFTLIFPSFAQSLWPFISKIFDEVTPLSIFVYSLFFFPFNLIYSVVSLFVGSTFMYIFILMFGGKKGYIQTFKAVAFAQAPLLIPLGIIFVLLITINLYLGFLVFLLGFLYMAFLLSVGISKLHSLSAGKSAAAIFVAFVAAIIISALIFLALFVIVKQVI